MLTPRDISNKEFVRAVFGGYDKTVVDSFLQSLAEDYTALYEENARLKRENTALKEKVENRSAGAKVNPV